MAEKHNEKGQKLRSRWRSFLRAIVIILLIPVFLSFIIQIPFVQKFTVNILTNSLEKRIDKDIEIKKVYLNPFKGLEIESSQISNKENGDTLLSVNKIVVSLTRNLFTLFNRELALNEIEIDGVYFDIIKEAGSTKNSFTILLEKLASSDKEKQKRGKPINLAVKKIRLNNIGYTVLDENSGSTAKYMLDEGVIEFNSLNMSSGYIDIESFVTRQPFIEIIKRGEGLRDTSKVEVITEGEAVEEIIDSIENKSMLVIRHFDMMNGTFIYKDLTADGINEHPNSLNTKNFELSEIALSADSFHYDPSWEIKADLKTISFKDDKGFHLKRISSENLVLSDTEITLPSMELTTERSNLKCDFAFLMDGLNDFSNFSNEVYISTDVSDGQIAISDLIHFVGDLNNSDFFAYNSNKTISIAGKYRGVVDNLSGKNVDIRFGNNLVFNGNFGTIDLTDSDNALVNLKFNRLNTSISYLREIIPGFRPPDNFSKLGNINFVGRYDGYFKDFVAAGKLSTDLGNVSLDMNLDVKDGNEKAQYSGELRLENFNVGIWSGNEKFGLVSFYSKVNEAEGLTLNTLYADLEANVESLLYNDYTYQDFNMDGEVKENEFIGQFNIEDENINLSFNGDVSYKDSILQLNLDADIKQLNLQELNFTDNKRNIAGVIKANMKGTGIENLIGQINSRNIIIETDSLTHRIDTFSVYAFNVPGQKSKLDLFSDFGAAKIDGTYNLRDVVPQIKSILKRNYPYHTRNWEIEEKEYEENKFVINLRIDDTRDILRLAGIEDFVVRNLRAKGNVDSSRDNFNLDTDIEYLAYKDYEFHNADLILGNRNDIGFAVVNIDSSIVAGRSVKPLFVETDLNKDTISFELSTKDVFDSLQVVDIGGSLSPHRRGYVLNVKDNEWQMLGEKWDFYSGNELIIGNKYLDIRDLVISDGYREIEIQDINKNGIALTLKRFNFLIINGIIDYDKIDFSGEGDLRVRVENIFEGDTYFSANAYIDDFRLNGERYGVLDVSFDKAPDKSYNALLSIAKEEQTVKANLVFDTESNQVSGSVRGRSFPLDIFEYIIQNGISETKGVADVDAEIFGPPDDLKIEGEALFMDGGVKIDYLGTSFFFNQQRMKINERFLDLTGGVLTDIEGNTGVMTGGLRHNLFRDFRLDVSMAAENAVIINTTKTDNPIYYGYGKGKVDVSFKGSFDATDMKIKATTAAGTSLNIPVEYTTTGYDQSFIKFVNKEELLAPRSEKEVDEFKIEGLNVEMELTMTEDADVKIIFNERLGDIIQGNGRGFMQIYARRTGEFEIFGDYEVEAGEYLFTAWGVVAKPFIVREGGRIKWTGDPINAALDIKADYQVRAPLSLFLDEFLQTATNDVQIEARTKQEINLQLLLGGTLYNPIVKFDLNFPNLQGEIKTYADSKLRGLRTNEIALNSQVLGLIVFNSFLPTVNSSELNYSDEAVVTAANTLSEFVSSQLSIYLTGLLQEALTDNSLIADIDFEIGMRKNSTLYAPETETDLLPDEIEVHVTNQFRFLDQRLSLGVGANYIADSPFGVSNYYVPDFVIEYFLTNDRQLKLRMYGRYDYDQVVIARRQRYGLGIGYRKEFGSLTDFINDVKKTAESIAEKEESLQRRQ